MHDPAARRRLRFSVFEADLNSGELFKKGQKVKLQGQPFELLVELLNNPGVVVTREQLKQRLWPENGANDFDSGLNRAINRIREVLSDSAESPHFIETLPRRGYRFIGTIQHEPGGVPASAQDVNAAIPMAGHVVQPEQTAYKSRRILWIFVGIAGALLVGAVWLAFRRATIPARVEVTQEQLTFNSGEDHVNSAAISPDANYLAYSDPSGIHVKLRSTNDERLIPPPPSVPPPVFWDVASWFPDGTRLLANLTLPGDQRSMWTFSLLDSSPRKLRDGAFGFEVSPDGEHIAFSPRGGTVSAPLLLAGAAHEIWVMDTRGENAKQLLSVGPNESLYSVHWSPGGDYLAYVRARDTSNGFLASVESCRLDRVIRTAVQAEPDIQIWDFCWLRSRRIVYSRQESPGSETSNLWKIGLESNSGAPATGPKRITQWSGTQLEGLSPTADGKRLALRKQVLKRQVYVGKLRAGNIVIDTPQRLTSEDADDFPSAWTADGKAVLFSSLRNGKYEILKQAIGEHTPEPVVVQAQSAVMPRVSPDGKFAFYQFAGPGYGYAQPSTAEVMRVPLAGGSPKLLLQSRNQWDLQCSHSPAMLCVVLERTEDRKQFLLTALDPLKGRGKLLRSIEADPLSLAYADGLSPDGSMFAIAKKVEPEIHIRLLSLAHAPDREIRVHGWGDITSLDWSADGKGMYCGSMSAGGGTLLYVNLAGIPHVVWQYKGVAPSLFMAMYAIPSPDGRYLALPGGSVWTSNVWMIEGF